MAEEFKPIDFDSLGSQKKREIPEGQESSTFDLNDDGSVGFGDILTGLGDVVAAPFRGVLDAGQGLIDTADMVTNWVGIDIPDTDINFLGDSKTMVGRGAQGLTNFLAGFVPIAGQISKGAKGVQFLSKAAQAAKTTKKGAAAVSVGRGAVAGGITDFAVMDAEMGNLSTMIQDTPALQGLQNPITDFLAHEGDDSELEKRIKNVMEGAGLGIFFDGMIESVKAIRAGQRVRRAGGTPEEAAAARDAEIKPTKPEAQAADDVVFEAEEGVMYHGTASELDPSSIDPYKTRVNGLYGPGLYLTENPNVAHGYSKARAGAEGTRRLYKVKLNETNLIDMDMKFADADPAVRKEFEKLHSGVADDFVEADIDQLNTMTLGDIYRDVTKTLSENPFMTEGEALGLIDEFQGAVNRLGYDGVKHLGGQIVGNVDHRVTILFDPSNTTSHGRANPIASMDDIASTGKPKKPDARSTVKVYRGGEVNPDNPLTYTTSKKGEANLYAEGKKTSEILTFELDANRIASEEEVRETLTELGFTQVKKDNDEYVGGMIHEYLDPEFKGEGFYLGDGVDARLAKALQDKGFDAYKAVGTDVRGTNRSTEEIVLVGKNPKQVKGPRDPSDPPVDDGAGPRDSGGDDLEGRKPGARGEKYFEENLDRVGDDRGVRQLVKDVVDDAREAGEVAPAERKSHAEMYSEAADDLDELDQMMGESSGRLKEALADEGEKAVSGIQRVRRLRLLQKRASDKAVEAARAVAAETSPGMDKLRAFVEARQKLRSVTLAGIEVKRALARELSGLAYTVDDLPDVPHITAKLDDGVDDALDDVFSEAGGGNTDIGASRIREEAQKIVDIADTSGDTAVVGAVRKTPDIGKMTMSVWVNFLLSGPKTQLVNALSGALATSFRPAEKAAGRFFTGDVSGSMSQLAQYNYILQNAGAATRLAKQSLFNNKPILLKGGKVSEVLDASGQEASAVMAAKYGILGLLGKGVTLPTRVLQTVDEFFKQLNYRSQVMVDLKTTAAQKGYDDNWVRESAEKMFSQDEMFTKDSIRRQAARTAKEEGLEPGSKEFNTFVRRFYGEMYDQELVQIANQGKRAAEDVTFTRELSEKGQGRIIRGAKKLQDLKGSGVFGTVLLPFVRTPAQLVEFFHRRSLGLVSEALQGNVADANRGLGAQFQRLREGSIKELAGATKEQRADFMGRVAAGSTLYGSIYAAASMDMITGSGPKDVNQRRLLEQSGWQPYSVKVGDTYYSYRRFDPFSSFIQVIADFQDHYKYNTRFKGEDQVEADVAEEFGLGMAFVTANLVRNKSFFAGLSAFADAIGDPSGFSALKFFRQLGGSIVPSVLSQTNQEYFDNELREPRSFLDAMKRRFPGLSDELPPRRDLFGKPLTVAETITSPILPGPLEVKTTSRSAVRRELAEVGANFGNPRKTRGDLDLTQYKMGKYDAYDRFQVLVGEIRLGGRTMEQQMSRLIQRSQYKRMGRESKMEQLNKILRQYRDAAWWQLVKENPQIKRDLRTSDQNEARDMRGQQQLPLSYQ